MDSIKQNIASEENDIFASKKKLAYKAINILINSTLYPEKPKNISFPIEIDPEYNFVDGFQIFNAIAVGYGGNLKTDFSIRTDYETICTDKIISSFRSFYNLISIRGVLGFFPTIIKGSGKKIWIDIKNIDWTGNEYFGGAVSITLNFVIRQVNNVAFPKFTHDILKKQFTQTSNNLLQEHIFKINTSFKEIIGVAFCDKDGIPNMKEISFSTDNINIINKLPNPLFSHQGLLSIDYFTNMYINNINNITFNLSTIAASGDYYAYFLVRKPFVQPY